METLITGALATARITRLIKDDAIAQPLRDRAMEAHPKLGELVQCPMCISVWAGAAVVVTTRVMPGLTRMLALSEAAILIREITDGR